VVVVVTSFCYLSSIGLDDRVFIGDWVRVLAH